jgi:hypothetical protein
MNSNAKEAFSPEPSSQEKTSSSNQQNITRNTAEIPIDALSTSDIKNLIVPNETNTLYVRVGRR